MTYQELFDRMKTEILSKTEWMSEKEIIDQLLSDASEGLFDNRQEIEVLVRKVLRSESKPDGIISKAAKKCKYGATGYKIKNISLNPPVRRRCKPETDTDNIHYTGKGAEFAVVAELMYSGYNANSMTVDEGIDIVASKDNIFYYIQVKSTYFDEASKKFNYSIPIVNFDRVSRQNNVFYIIAVRGAPLGSLRSSLSARKQFEITSATDISINRRRI